jgi:hypothetical protein
LYIGRPAAAVCLLVGSNRMRCVFARDDARQRELWILNVHAHSYGSLLFGSQSNKRSEAGRQAELMGVRSRDVRAGTVHGGGGEVPLQCRRVETEC